MTTLDNPSRPRRANPISFFWVLASYAVTCLLAVPGFTQSYPFRCWTTTDGLAQSVVNVMLEDSKGFFWLGTANGLSRFDGRVFVNFDDEDGLPSARIYSLFEDRRGILWAGTDRGPARFDGRHWTAPFAETALAGARVLAIAETASEQDHQLVFGTRRAGLFMASNGELVLPAVDDGAESKGQDETGSIFTLVSAGAQVWAGTERGMSRVVEGGLERAFLEAPWKDAKVSALATDDSDRVLVASSEGGYVVDPETGDWRLLVEASAGELTAVNAGLRNRVWFGTHHQGLLRRQEAGWTRLGELNGLPVEGIRALARHSDGGLWVGTFAGGACRLNSESFSLFTKAHGLPNEQVLGLAEGPGGELWVSSLEGGVARFDGTHFEVFGKQQGLRSLAVPHLTFDASGTLWAGTLRGGLHRFVKAGEGGGGRSGAFEAIDLNTERPLTIFHVMVDQEGALWLSTWGAGLYRYRPDRGKVRALTDGLLSRRIFSTSQDRDGQIWIAMTEGVQTLDPKMWNLTTFESEQDPPQGRVRTSVHDEFGRTYLATDRGVARWDGERFTYFARGQGLASNQLYLAALDQRSNLWVGSQRGLDRLRLDAEGRFAQWEHFGVDEGFTGLEANQNSILEDSRGRLWIGTKGLARFDPDEEAPASAAPRLHLTDLRLFDGTKLPLDSGLPITLAPRKNSLAFDFVGLNFAAPAAVRYRYRLRGQGEDWSPPSTDRSAVFLNLTPGKYTFEVISGIDEQWSDPAQIDFEIRPTIWATWWLRGGVVALFFLSCAIWLYRRQSAQKRRRIELEYAVEERTRELKSAKLAAEAASAAKSEFLSNMSHELRTPLTGVVSASELLAKTMLDGDQQILINTIGTSGRALLSIVNDIMDQAKIEARGLQIDARVFSPLTCFRECLEIVQHTAESKGLHLGERIGSGLPERVVGDPVRFRQVLINLLGNAIKFTDQGSVEAGLEKGADRDGRLKLKVAVRDTGAGIPEHLQGRIFEPFEQVDTSSTRSFGGTGLGLSICERLVTMMGGEISVESELGVGSTFRFEVEVGTTGVAEKPDSVEVGALPQIRADLVVLLVEDNPVSRLVTGSQLEDLGLKPHECANGVEALATFHALSPDVILMDGQMPEMDGYAASRAIREAEAEDSHVIIIGFTAHATAEARGVCLEAGMDDYLAKPVDLATLAERLAHWFPYRSMEE